MSPELEKLKLEVQEDKDVKTSAINLLNGLNAKVTQIKAELAEQGVTNATLNELSTDLDTNTNALAEAVVANTQPE